MNKKPNDVKKQKDLDDKRKLRLQALKEKNDSRNKKLEERRLARENALKEREKARAKATAERKKALEIKFRNKEELAKSKAELQDSLNAIKAKMKNARLEENKLKLQLKKEADAERIKLAKDKKDTDNELKEQKLLIAQNKRQLEAERVKLAQQVKLQKQEAKNELLEAKQKNNADIANVKGQIAFEKLQQKQKLDAIKMSARKDLLETKEEIARAQDAVNQFKIEQEKLIAEKKAEVIDKQKELIELRSEAKVRAQKERAAKLIAKEKEKQELHELAIKAKAKHDQKVLELQAKTLDKELENEKATKKYILEFERARNEINEQRAQANKDNVEHEIELQQRTLDTVNEHAEADVQFENGSKQAKTASKSKEAVGFDSHMVSGVTVEINTSDFVPNIDNQQLRGQIIDKVGSHGLKLYEAANREDTKLSLSKIKLEQRFIEDIKLFQELKNQKLLIDIREFGKYISYILDKDVTSDELQEYIVSSIAFLLKGKTLSFLGGYLRLERHKKLSLIAFDKKLVTHAHTVVSLPQSEFVEVLEKMIIDKLNRGAVVQVSNNIALKVDNGEVKVLCDLPFLEV